MDAATFLALQTMLDMLGNAALIFLTPAVLWNTYRMIVMDIEIRNHLKSHAVIETRLKKHGEQIDELYQRGR